MARSITYTYRQLLSRRTRVLFVALEVESSSDQFRKFSKIMLFYSLEVKSANPNKF
jgi:hypothetical protein